MAESREAAQGLGKKQMALAQGRIEEHLVRGHCTRVLAVLREPARDVQDLGLANSKKLLPHSPPPTSHEVLTAPRESDSCREGCPTAAVGFRRGTQLLPAWGWTGRELGR